MLVCSIISEKNGMGHHTATLTPVDMSQITKVGQPIFYILKVAHQGLDDLYQRASMLPNALVGELTSPFVGVCICHQLPSCRSRGLPIAIRDPQSAEACHLYLSRMHSYSQYRVFLSYHILLLVRPVHYP